MYSDSPSVKDAEQARRCRAAPIILSAINEFTPFPRDPSTFWSSKHNKLELEKLIYSNQRKTSSSAPYPTVISTVIRNDEA